MKKIRAGQLVRVKPGLSEDDWRDFGGDRDHPVDTMVDMAGSAIEIYAVRDTGWIIAGGWKWHPDWLTDLDGEPIQ